MKRLGNENVDLDLVDLQILQALTNQARLSMAELAREIGMSAPSVTERVRRLEERGVITGYHAHVDPAALGLPITVLIRVRPVPGRLKQVAEILRSLEAIVECDRITGDDCYVAKAHLASVADLEGLLDEINPHARTNTSILQSSPVPRRLPPIDLDGGGSEGG